MNKKDRKPSPAPVVAAPTPSLDSLLVQASRDTTADLRKVVKSEDIPVEFWRVLEVLADECGHSMTSLAHAAGMALPATSKVVDRMAEDALIVRSIDPSDQRRVLIYISDFGLKKVKSLEEEVREYRNQLEQEFPAHQMKDLRDLLQGFIAARNRAFQRR